MEDKRKLSILHINTHDGTGGAAKVAWRLAEAQRNEGYDSRMLVGNKMTRSKYSYSFPLEPDMFIQNQCRRKGQLCYEFHGSHRLVRNRLVTSADILHLHNLHGSYFNPFSLSAISQLKPVVWTLHDMQSITGHCAHSLDCEKWQTGCDRCPYLNVSYEIPVDSSAQLLRDKKLIYDHSYLQIVTPSKWLKDKVERSILQNHPVELIYNGIDTNVFRPWDKEKVRRKFGIPANVLVIGAVATGGALSNYWKGGQYTQAALDSLSERFPHYIFVNIGGDSKTNNPRIVNISCIDHEDELAQAYSILDIFLYTPVADNCPLVVIETLSCGVPIVTFDTGGIPELVRDGLDGCVSAFGDLPALVRNLERVAVSSELRSEFSRNARESATSKFDHKAVAEQYQNLYERCLRDDRTSAKKAKLFPLEKVPKIILSDAFIKAENSKYVLLNRNRISQKDNNLVSADGERKTSKVLTKSVEVAARRTSLEKKRTEDKKQEYLVSAIVSTYNAERFIRGCLEDLENQTIADKLEIIVVNSGSEQNEEAVVREFQQNYGNIKYIRTEERETVYQAWNRAIKVSSGKYITNANTDDKHTRDALEKMARALDENPDKVLVYANQVMVNEIDGRRVVCAQRVAGDYSRSRLLDREAVVGSQPMWSRRVHEEFGYFDEGFFIAGDDEFWLRISTRYDFLYLDENLGERLVAQGCLSAAHEALGNIENYILSTCYSRELAPTVQVDYRAISGNPLFSSWPEINFWKQKVKAKLTGKDTHRADNIKDSWDCRTSHTPELSIVILACDRYAELLESLNALNGQTQKEFEVIVVSNGIDLSQLRNNVGQFTYGLCGIELRDDFGPSMAKNIGTDFARGQYLAFLDEDAIAHKNFAANIIQHFQDYPICGLRGKVLPQKEGGYEPDICDLGDQIIISACLVSPFSAYTKDVLINVGGFNEMLFGVEGLELSYRICETQKQRMKSIMYFPDVVVYHDSARDDPAYSFSKVRQQNMEQLARRKHRELSGYGRFIRASCPAGQGQNDYDQLMGAVSFLQKDYPEEAVKWAEKAVALRADSVTCLYTLGCLYTKLDQYDRAEVPLQEVLNRLSKALDRGDIATLNSDFRNITAAGMCYCDTCLRLARCHMKQGKHDEAKSIYTNLLNNQYLKMSRQQEDRIRSEMAKLDETPPNLPVAAEKKSSASIPVESRDADFAGEPARMPKESSTIRASDCSQASCDVSIILCTKDRAQLLDQMLASLSEAVGGVTYEVIVVEGDSGDNTRDVLHKHGITEVYSEAEYVGPGTHSWPQLYNFGFSRARGKWAMYCSDDILFGKDCISRAVTLLNRQKDEVAGGVFFYRNAISRPDWDKFGIDFTDDSKLLINYGLVRLDYFRDVAGLDEAYKFYYADTDFCYKLYQSGRQLVPLPGCFVFHNNVIDTQRLTHSAGSDYDRRLCRQRWKNFVPDQIARPRRLIWQEELWDAFNLPTDLERIHSGIELFWHGLAYFQRGLFEDAKFKFLQTIESRCDHWLVLWYLANAAYECRDMELAEKSANSVVKLKPDFIEAPDFLAQLACKSKQVAAVIGWPECKAFQKIDRNIGSVRCIKDEAEQPERMPRAVKERENNLVGLIFTKDRAMQLRAAMESFFLHCGDSEEIKLYVLYKASNQLHSRNYERLRKDFGSVSFIEEANFREQMLDVISGVEYVLFLVDDNLFVKDFYLADIVRSLRDNDDALGFSLRLGRNTGYCYAQNAGQALPAFQHAGRGVFKYDWTQAEFDFAYPLELSSSVYRSADIRPLLTKIEFENPNILEGLMAANARLYSRTRPSLICYEYSVTFSNPINMVQSVSANRVGSNDEYSTGKLAQLFEDGFEIDVGRYSDFVPHSCHHEVELKFRKTGIAIASDRPLVSVEMVTYNSEKFIRQAVDSVLAQSYRNFELLVVDDGSTDRTKEIVASYSDSRMRYIYKPHKNAASARNRAIAEARGDYVICVDSDDFIAEDYIEKMVVSAENHPEADYFYPAKLVLVDESANPTDRLWEYLNFSDNAPLPHFLFDQGYAPIPNAGSLKRRSLFDKVGLYEDLDTLEDFVFLCKNALKIKFKRVDEHSPYFYRRLTGSLSSRFRARDQITARVLNDMVAIYPPEILCPMIAEITDPYLSKREYYKYLMTTFYKHAGGHHMVQYGRYFQEYGNCYKRRLLQMTRIDKMVCSPEKL